MLLFVCVAFKLAKPYICISIYTLSRCYAYKNPPKVTGPFAHFRYSIPLFYLAYICYCCARPRAQHFEMQTGNLNIEITDLWLIFSSSCWQEQNRSLAIKYQRDFPGARHRSHIYAVCLLACLSGFSLLLFVSLVLFYFLSIKFNVQHSTWRTHTPCTAHTSHRQYLIFPLPFYCSVHNCNQHHIAINNIGLQSPFVFMNNLNTTSYSNRVSVCARARKHVFCSFGFVFSFIL